MLNLEIIFLAVLILILSHRLADIYLVAFLNPPSWDLVFLHFRFRPTAIQLVPLASPQNMGVAVGISTLASLQS